MFEFELTAAADQRGRISPTDDRRQPVGSGLALPPEVREPMTNATVTEPRSGGKTIARFIPQDPYRELPPGAVRVDFCESSYVQLAGRVRS